jgi:hypothetical protein
MSKISDVQMSEVVVIATDAGGVIGSFFTTDIGGELFSNDDTTSVTLVVEVVGMVEAKVIVNCGKCPPELEVNSPKELVALLIVDVDTLCGVVLGVGGGSCAALGGSSAKDKT